MAIKDEIICIGKLTGTRGIKGYLKININKNLYLNNFFENELLFVDIDNQIVPIKVENFIEINNIFLIKIENCNSIEDSKIYVGRNVYFLKTKFNLFFEEKVNYKNFKVIENNKIIGCVIDYMENMSYVSFKVQRENNNCFWLPNVKKFVLNVDIGKKKIIVRDCEVLF